MHISNTLRQFAISLITLVIISSCGSARVKKAHIVSQPVKEGPPELGFKDACLGTNSLRLQNTQQLVETELSRPAVDGIPICKAYSRTTLLKRNGNTLKHGQDLRQMNLAIASLPHWDSVEDITQKLKQLSLASEHIQVKQLDRCWWLDEEQQLVPAWMAQVRTDQSAYQLYLDESQVYAIAPMTFDAVGSIDVYTEGENPQRRGVAIKGMQDSGYLESAAFKTIMPTYYERANETSLTFDYADHDPRFAEAAVFANASLTLDWFRQLYSDSVVDESCFPIDLHVHKVLVNGGKNNAEYHPVLMTDTGRPEIYIGDGDGLSLQNLGSDPDVISHEFGHHIVFRGIKETTDYDSRVLHEGLADFFTFARTGNACLGESICPQNSLACWVQNKCLRTGDNALTFNDANLPSSYHQRSQVISGLLWDIGQKLDMHDWAATVAHSIRYLLPRSTYKDLIVALMTADHEMSNGASACVIFNAALDRGMQDMLKDIDCADYQ